MLTADLYSFTRIKTNTSIPARIRIWVENDDGLHASIFLFLFFRAIHEVVKRETRDGPSHELQHQVSHAVNRGNDKV